MNDVRFTVVYWNVWLATQDGTNDSGNDLVEALNKIIIDYSPDAFGFNEILVDSKTNQSIVLDFLKSQGYYVYFCKFSPLNDQWNIGSAFASKIKWKEIKSHILGSDSLAEKRGYPNQKVQLIEANLQINGQNVTVITNYLMALFPGHWYNHRNHRINYEKFLENIDSDYLIIGGDFNETKFMPSWLKLPSTYKRLTGTILHPTWLWNGKPSLIVRANYNNIVYKDNQNLTLENFKVLKRQPSDHTPLLAAFIIN